MKITSLFTSMKVLVATSIGGGLEMYDFVMYLFFAPTIAQLFFPEDNPFTRMMALILLTLCRLLQGISVRTDLAGGITFIAEHAMPKTRGLNCGLMYLGVSTGLMGASVAATLITYFCSSAQLMDWGWRIGFCSSALLVVVGFYLRRGFSESMVFLQA